MRRLLERLHSIVGGMGVREGEEMGRRGRKMGVVEKRERR